MKTLPPLCQKERKKNKKHHNAEENCYMLFQHELNTVKSATTNIKKYESTNFKLWHWTKKLKEKTKISERKG